MACRLDEIAHRQFERAADVINLAEEYEERLVSVIRGSPGALSEIDHRHRVHVRGALDLIADGPARLDIDLRTPDLLRLPWSESPTPRVFVAFTRTVGVGLRRLRVSHEARIGACIWQDWFRRLTR